MDGMDFDVGQRVMTPAGEVIATRTFALLGGNTPVRPGRT